MYRIGTGVKGGIACHTIEQKSLVGFGNFRLHQIRIMEIHIYILHFVARTGYFHSEIDGNTGIQTVATAATGDAGAPAGLAVHVSASKVLGALRAPIHTARQGEWVPVVGWFGGARPL